MSIGPNLVREKSHHSRLQIQAHDRAIRCLYVQPSSIYQQPPKVFTAGDDRTLRIFDGKNGLLLAQSSQICNSKITCMSVAGHTIYLGTENGEVIRLTDDGIPRMKFQAHKSEITCIQGVNQGRVFTGSLDCTVKLFSPEGDPVRQFPIKPQDCKEPIVSLRVITGNLLFTGSKEGVIRVYNMRGELIKILRTRELDGCPLYHMQLVTGATKISIVCAYENKLTLWYLTLINDEFGDPSVDVDAVKSILSRIPSGRISAIKVAFINPLKTNRPCVYLGSTTGAVHIIVPEGKGGFVYANNGQRVYAPKFKEYSFKDARAPILALNTGGGRLFGGTSSGALYVWKESLAMLQLRKFSMGKPDTHAYASTRKYHSVLIEAEPNSFEEPVASSASMESFAKMVDSDITEDDVYEPEYQDTITLATMRESAPPSNPSASYRPASVISPANDRAALFARKADSPAPPVSRSSFAPPSQVIPLSTSQNNNPEYVDMIIKLLFDSANELDTLPDPLPLELVDQFNRMSFSQPSATPPQFQSQYQATPPSQFQSLSQAQPLSSQFQSQQPQQPAFQSQFQPNPNQYQSLSQTQLASQYQQPQFNQPSQFNSQAPQSSLPSQQFQSLQRQTPASAPIKEPQLSERETVCTVCLDAPKNAALYTCGHVCVCYDCGLELIKRKSPCPLCRAPIQDCIKVYK